jgi:hypothetical protein
MARVVAVHGIGQELLGPHTLLTRAWFDPLNDGLEHAGASPLPEGQLVCAFYGDLYRPSGYKSGQVPPYEAVWSCPAFVDTLAMRRVPVTGAVARSWLGWRSRGSSGGVGGCRRPR